MVGHGQGLRITSYSAIMLVADQSASADRSITQNPAHKTFFPEKSMQNMKTGLQKHQTGVQKCQTGLGFPC